MNPNQPLVGKGRLKVLNELKSKTPTTGLLRDHVNRGLPIRTCLQDVPRLVKDYKNLVNYLVLEFPMKIVSNWSQQASPRRIRIETAHNVISRIDYELKKAGITNIESLLEYRETLDALREMNN